MTHPKDDPSLTEIRQWREKLQSACDETNDENKMKFIDEKSQEIVKRYGLKLNYVYPTRKRTA